NNLFANNYSLVVVKIGRDESAHNYFISNSITDKSLTSSLDNSNVFRLYIYPETNGQQTISQTKKRTPNLDAAIVKTIADKLGLQFTNEKETTKNTFAPIDLLDYIYAVLHSPSYREKYKEFLKIDFPRVPYPKDKETFWKLIKLGSELRQLHLLESQLVNKPITKYPIDGNNLVEKVSFELEEQETEKVSTVLSSEKNIDTKHDTISFPQYHLNKNDETLLHEPKVLYGATPKPVIGKVWINPTQYFENVPKSAWEFFIGGYQPAQKWLKDRKGIELSFEDIIHYQKIIVALTETDRLMKEIDEINFMENNM
ncbi:MAG: hypothetical protein RIQ33_1173, partial [Bacteroidota bacterium]